MNDDLRELLELLKSQGVEFLVVGGHAVSFHARPRMTEDVDVWVGRRPENVQRLAQVLASFGAPISAEGAKDFSERENQMVRLGVPPNMVDILNFGGNKPFEEVWSKRVAGTLEGIDVDFPSSDDLIDMKLAASRPQDLADIAAIRRAKR
jgi:hypothetical protein